MQGHVCVERELKDADETARFRGRRSRNVPVLKGMRTWLDKALPTVAPKSALGKAIAYMCHYWPKLIRFVEWGDAPIDNNRAENAIRPFVVGSKAWMFSDTPAGTPQRADLPAGRDRPGWHTCPCWSAYTSSPTLNSRTRGPTLTTTPATSWPRMSGRR